MNTAESLFILDHLQKSHDVLFGHLYELPTGCLEQRGLEQELDKHLLTDMNKVDLLDKRVRLKAAEQEANYMAVHTVGKAMKAKPSTKNMMKAKQVTATKRSAMRRPAGSVANLKPMKANMAGKAKK